MVHDKNGRRIEIGDFVKAQPCNDAIDRRAVVGRVAELRGTFEPCVMVWAGIGNMRSDYFTPRFSELIVKADGSDPE
jgi:hypothetical protein